MKVPCGYCRNPFPKVRLHRVGNRLLCARCFSAIRNAPTGGADTGPHLDATDFRRFLRQTVLSTLAGLAGKTLLFVPLFLWAASSDVGAAALRGAVAADVFTWIALSLLAWPFRRLQVGVGLFFEVALVVGYVYREDLFDITANSIESTAMSALFFFLVAFLKAAVWTVEHTFEVTGVTERA